MLISEPPKGYEFLGLPVHYAADVKYDDESTQLKVFFILWNPGKLCKRAEIEIDDPVWIYDFLQLASALHEGDDDNWDKEVFDKKQYEFSKKLYAYIKEEGEGPSR